MLTLTIMYKNGASDKVPVKTKAEAHPIILAARQNPNYIGYFIAELTVSGITAESEVKK